MLRKEISVFVKLYKMKVEEIDSTEREKANISPGETESLWNQHRVSTFQKIREKELLRLNHERPSKFINRQEYYNYRAREEQIKYELCLREYCLELLRCNLFEAFDHYHAALNHLKRRGEYEKKLYAVWLERVKAQEHPPAPDIVFINQGIRANKVI